MIHELTAASYDKVKTLYEPLTFMPFCAGVLEGCHDGRVFVDDLRQPRTAFMLTWGCWGFLGGDPDNAGFVRALNEALFAKVFLGEHAWGLFMSCPPDGWAEQLAAVCAPRPPIELPRRHYVARSIGDGWQANVPQGYAIRRMDSSLLDLPGIALPDDVTKMIDVIDWDADVVDKGCGFVALYDGQVAAHAMIDCVVGNWVRSASLRIPPTGGAGWPRPPRQHLSSMGWRTGCRALCGTATSITLGLSGQRKSSAWNANPTTRCTLFSLMRQTTGA